MSLDTAPNFHFFNYQHYLGPNLYLNTSALVFDLALGTEVNLHHIDDYLVQISQQLPPLRKIQISDYITLVARTISEVNKLELELPLESFSIHSERDFDRIAIASLDERTSRGVVDLVRDWLEAITRREKFDFSARLRYLQKLFRRSIYGGPTSYALLRAAYSLGIPAFYLPDERLIQYGYGKYQVRGISTTFDRDSHLDSDFTTYKDDCKEFLARCGFPVPFGKVVSDSQEALATAAAIGYPVAVKPVVGHKGMGVTANIQTERALELAFSQAKAASVDTGVEIIVEQSLAGSDFRLLCVGGEFVAAMERRPPFVIGDGTSTVAELIEQENNTPMRQDSPTSALAPIIIDEVLENYLEEQNLSVNSILKPEQLVYLRQVANISSGGVSVDVTPLIHPDNRQLASEIAQYFRLVCLGIDVITPDLSQSWQEGNLGIIEINAAPGVFMHLKPAIGNSIDVPSRILKFLFGATQPCRIPIITCNRLLPEKLVELINYLLKFYPHWLIGGVCRGGVWLNNYTKNYHYNYQNYNCLVQSLLRHPQLDLLIAEYPEGIFIQEGIAYLGSNVVILEEPTEIEKILARDVLPQHRLIIQQEGQISVGTKDGLEPYKLADSESFADVYRHQSYQMLSELVGAKM
ncbi:MAG: cyanophycin synthetase [Xenococcaceae cyanobacterium]